MEDEASALEFAAKLESFLEAHPERDHDILRAIIESYPEIIDPDSVIESLLESMWAMTRRDDFRESLAVLTNWDEETRLRRLKECLKKGKQMVPARFDQWVREEGEQAQKFLVILSLCQCRSRSDRLGQQYVLLNRQWWRVWEKRGQFI